MATFIPQFMTSLSIVPKLDPDPGDDYRNSNCESRVEQ
jgi:hypothetical protein